MKKSLMNNISLKLLAFLFAFLLWLIVVNIDDPIIDKTFSDIPVTVEHAEVITGQQKTYQIVDNTQTVAVTVYAKRSVLNKMTAEDIQATADMKELYLESQIPIEVKIAGYEGRYDSVSSNPRNLQIKIEKNASKSFAITPVATGTVRDGYLLGELKSSPEKVTINGPESVIERISRVTAEVDVSGLARNSDLETSLRFFDADNEEIDQSLLGNNLGSYGVSVNVSLLNTRTIPVVLDTSNVAAEEGYSIADITWTPQEIVLAGTEEDLQDVNDIYIPASALGGEPVRKKTDITIDITEYLPENVQLLDEGGNNVIVTITVERDGTKSFDLPVGSIAVKNLDEKFKMSFSSSEDLEVHVRGAKETLDTLNIEELASIDMKSQTSAGDYTVPVSIELPSGCTLEGTVQVQVTLEEK